MDDRQLYRDLARITDHPVAMGKITIPSLLVMIGNGYAEIVTGDRIKITEGRNPLFASDATAHTGRSALNQLNLKEFHFPGSVVEA